MASLVPLASLIVPIIGIAAAGMRTAGTVVCCNITSDSQTR